MDIVPESTEHYSETTYWETRFENERHHEWFAPYDQFKHLITPHVSRTSQILILGNGASTLPVDLHYDGFRHITATDICSNVIQRLKTSKEEILYEVADMLALPYQNSSFDVIIEKGTLDVLFTEAKSLWNPPEHVLKRMDKATNEIYRVLTPQGIFLSISFTQPHFRTDYFRDLEWRCDVDRFGEAGSLEYFVYRLTKGSSMITEKTSVHSEQKWEAIENPMHDYMDNASFLYHIDI